MQISSDIDRPSCGGYKIIQTLGKGGNAVVKQVEKDGVQYAMKIFEPHRDDRDEFIRDTQIELAVVQNLNMNAVSKYFEFVTDGIWCKRNGQNTSCCYLVMELIEGVELIDFFNAAKR